MIFPCETELGREQGNQSRNSERPHRGLYTRVWISVGVSFELGSWVGRIRKKTYFFTLGISAFYPVTITSRPGLLVTRYPEGASRQLSYAA